MTRLSWDEYFIEICKAVAKRSTCDRGMSGALLVKDKRIISTGYVGSPKGLSHCNEVGHLLKKFTDENGNESTHCIRTTHAEQNAIVQAALHGVSTDGTTMYCKMEPCIDCAKLIINAGIVRVICEKKYHKGELTRDIFKKSGVEFIVLTDEIEKYDNQ